MNGEIDKEALPLTALTLTAQETLSLLSTNKVIPTEGPEKLPRDWRGLAALLKIPSEVTSSIHDNSKRLPKIIEIWLQRKDDTATIGTLFQYLQRIDRFDIHDDLVELDKLGQLVRNYVVSRPLIPLEELSDDYLTYDDATQKSLQYYHALVLHAREDQEFVNELLGRMRSDGFKLCTEDDVLPVFSAPFPPISKLMTERCHRIILIYSPEFLNSQANQFFMTCAQAISIEMRKPKIIPCMYRPCQLPAHLTFYHKLYYSPPSEKSVYNFWEKLSQALDMVNLPRVKTSTTTQKAINTSQYKSIQNTITASDRTGFLTLPEPRNTQPTTEVKLPDTETIEHSQNGTTPKDTQSRNLLQSSSNLSREQRKKFTTLRKIMNNLKGKKEKVVMVEN